MNASRLKLSSKTCMKNSFTFITASIALHPIKKAAFIVSTSVISILALHISHCHADFAVIVKDF